MMAMETTIPLHIAIDTRELDALIQEIESMLPAGGNIFDFICSEEFITNSYWDNVTPRAYERIVIFHPSQRLKDFAAALRANQFDSSII